MIESMTGFGRGESKDDARDIIVEIKCVNHRYFDTYLKMPKSLGKLEDKIIKHLKKHLNRGRAEVFVSIKNTGIPQVSVSCNEFLAEKYFSAINNMGKNLGISKPVSLDTIMKFPDILVIDSVKEDLDALWETMETALSEALSSALEMRKTEGRNISVDILNRLNNVETSLSEIDGDSKELVANYRDKLSQRLQELQKGIIEIDENRIAQELVIYSDKTDVSEELVRAESHLKQLKKLIEASEPVGRKMDFLMQELNRETNTIGSKSAGTETSKKVVDIKVELEKIREQVQNIV